MKNIRIHFSQPDFYTIPIELNYEVAHFNGGELGVKIKREIPLKYKESCELFIEARLQNTEDFVLLGLLKNALENIYPKARFTLFMPYCQYGIQDRVCDFGEAFSLKFFSDYVNNMNFSRVVTLDPHSDVIGSVFNNLEIQEQDHIVTRFQKLFSKLYDTDFAIVSPDAGSNKKIGKIAKKLLKKDFIRADKIRDCSNGNILETKVYGDVPKRVAIIDDICDGGRTFIELAKVLKSKGAKEILLYVTHGIFSQGYERLLESGITEIYHTDSFRKEEKEQRSEVSVLKLNLRNYYL